MRQGRPTSTFASCTVAFLGFAACSGKPPLEMASAGGGVSTSSASSSGTSSNASSSGSTSSGSSGGTTTGGSTSGSSTTGTGTTGGQSSTTSGSSNGSFTPGPSCVPGGKPCAGETVCSLVASVTSLGFQCQPPAEFYPCLPGWTCAESSLVCTRFGNGSFCVEPCTTSDDCADPLALCQTVQSDGGVCLLRECGPHSNPANGSAPFGSCDAADAGDGQCVDLAFSDGAAGACVRTGTLAVGDPCSYYLTDGSADGICERGTTCFVSVIDGRSSRCLPLCDSTTTCAHSQLCFGAVPPIDPPPLSASTVSIGFGACVDLCTLGNDGGCASGFTCKPNPAGSGGICDPG
jgi:hypothetical protein